MSATTRFLLGLGLLLLLGGCAREWMKVNERYTVEDFRRDYADCSRGGTLDEPCMRSRGWVDVTPKAEKPPTPPPPERRAPATPRK
jgi:hypothetical protein